MSSAMETFIFGVKMQKSPHFEHSTHPQLQRKQEWTGGKNPREEALHTETITESTIPKTFLTVLSVRPRFTLANCFAPLSHLSELGHEQWSRVYIFFLIELFQTTRHNANRTPKSIIQRNQPKKKQIRIEKRERLCPLLVLSRWMCVRCNENNFSTVKARRKREP